ncbi:hypothetical protein [Oceanicella sp. SM1341]|uniref:hypothetical protein n=1 Tax=Oceanicella sp. SM1341 TaxID=1548889 RepID=UPI000E4DF74B|nr:hypothetical protein [Oceanicella sp. SM1341]
MTFRDALISRIDAPGGPSLRAVAEGAKVSYEQLKKIKQGKSGTTNVEDAVAVAAYFGLTVNEFLDSNLAADRADVARLYSQLRPEERAILLDAARGRASRGQAED